MKGEPIPEELLDAGERMSPEELSDHQLTCPPRTLRNAYDKVELYRREFDAAGLTPKGCHSLSDLAMFPCTTKADLRDTYPFGMFAVPMKQVRRVHASSGTTGRPTVVGYTENDLSMWADVVARSIRAAGGRPGHKVHVSYGYGLVTGGLGAQHLAADRDLRSGTVDGGDAPRDRGTDGFARGGHLRPVRGHWTGRGTGVR